MALTHDHPDVIEIDAKVSVAFAQHEAFYIAQTPEPYRAAVRSELELALIDAKCRNT